MLLEGKVEPSVFLSYGTILKLIKNNIKVFRAIN